MVEAGYNSKQYLEELSEENLSKMLPDMLAKRIKKSFPAALSSFPSKNLFTESCTLHPVLEISQWRPDRIIFEGKEIEVAAKEFSLIHLLAKNRGKILTHNDLLDTIWKETEDATYVQITYHLYKIRRNILKAIGNNKKVKNPPAKQVALRGL